MWRRSSWCQVDSMAMVELRIFGTPTLSASGRKDAETLAGQPKRFALLAYLATAPAGGARSRDRLAALFWPESDARRARSSLSQALYVLRLLLPDGALVSVGDGTVAVGAGRIWCDAVAFEDALDAGRPEEALALYRGDLLDGFFVSGCPDFEAWLEAERTRLRERASGGAWAVAEAEARDGNAVEATRWARWAADFLPADEVVVRRLMTFLSELGDRTAALRAYEAFAWRLAQEYELEPSEETQHLAAAWRMDDAPPTVVGLPEAPPSARARARPPARAPSSSSSSVSRPNLSARGARSMSRRRLAGAGALLAAVAAAGVLSMDRPSIRPPPVVRFPLEFGSVTPVASGVGGATLALSPDGSRLAFLGAGKDGLELWVRPIGRLEAAAVPYTRGATHPFFSPDGKWLGFVSGNEIRKVPVGGGPAITISTVETNVPGASWGTNDTIVFATPGGLWQVPAAGGEPSRLAASDTPRGERYRWPHVLPGGRAAVFTSVDETGFHLAAVTLPDGVVRPLGLEGTSPRFVTGGHLVFARLDGALVAVPFDPRSLRITGPARAIAEDLLVGTAGAAKVGISDRGTLAYQRWPGNNALVLVDRAGEAEALPVASRRFGGPRFSPDGRQLALVIAAPGSELHDVFVLDLGSGTLHRVTSDEGNVSPTWHPDGERIAFSHKPGGRPFGWSFRWVRVDGTDSRELLPARFDQFASDFTPDGRALVFERAEARTGVDVWVLPLEGEGAPWAYLRGPADERSPAVSPDAAWLAYVSDESGQDEVYVRPFPGPGAPLKVSAEGGWEPRWASRGRELFHRSAEGLVAVSIRRNGDAPAVADRQVLFDVAPYLSQVVGAGYDVHPDGRRFAMVRRETDERVIVVLNWFDQLRAGGG